MTDALSELDPRDPNFAVELVDRLLPIAMERGASDVHLQPKGDAWEVFVRIDGVLTPLARIDGGGPSDPVTRLMVLADLPTYRSTRPMEGRLRWPRGASGKQEHESSGVSMRLGVFPTVFGPRAVIRVLRQDASFDSLESLGFSQEITHRLSELTQSTEGAILMSGPAGSGKTTTMYAMLRQIAGVSPRRSVMTIEDPVESVIDSISQSELDPQAGMSLASALRSAVRQDSEVLLVSEIRDPETAEAALQASLTGHLVFSSLHATDVATALRRLVQLGVPPHVVRSGLRAVVSQRLLRRRCCHCQCGSDSVASRDDSSGRCKHCLGSGYRGRIAFAQVIRFDGDDPVGEAFAGALELNSSVDQMRRAASEQGGRSLWDLANELVEQGLTDQQEVYRVLGRGPARG